MKTDKTYLWHSNVSQLLGFLFMFLKYSFVLPFLHITIKSVNLSVIVGLYTITPGIHTQKFYRFSYSHRMCTIWENFQFLFDEKETWTLFLIIRTLKNSRNISFLLPFSICDIYIHIYTEVTDIFTCNMIVAMSVL